MSSKGAPIASEPSDGAMKALAAGIDKAGRPTRIMGRNPGT
jgi:hypothetical protein